MQLNEHMANGTADRIDPKSMRQYLQTNQFYQQHSRDPSNGRFNGTRLLFAIPHTKLKPDYIDQLQGKVHHQNPKDLSDTVIYNQTHNQSVSEDRTESVMINERIISPKVSYAKTDEFIRVNEQIIANDVPKVR